MLKRTKSLIHVKHGEYNIREVLENDRPFRKEMIRWIGKQVDEFKVSLSATNEKRESVRRMTLTFDSFFDVEDFFRIDKYHYLEYDKPICEQFRSFYRDFLSDLIEDSASQISLTDPYFESKCLELSEQIQESKLLSGK